jgi:hypothetical protein
MKFPESEAADSKSQREDEPDGGSSARGRGGLRGQRPQPPCRHHAVRGTCGRVLRRRTTRRRHRAVRRQALREEREVAVLVAVTGLSRREGGDPERPVGQHHRVVSVGQLAMRCAHHVANRRDVQLFGSGRRHQQAQQRRSAHRAAARRSGAGWRGRHLQQGCRCWPMASSADYAVACTNTSATATGLHHAPRSTFADEKPTSLSMRCQWFTEKMRTSSSPNTAFSTRSMASQPKR